MDPHLTDDKADLLVAELDRIIEYDRYPLSPRITALREIRAMLKPYPAQPAARRFRGSTRRRLAADIASGADEVRARAASPTAAAWPEI